MSLSGRLAQSDHGLAQEQEDHQHDDRYRDADRNPQRHEIAIPLRDQAAVEQGVDDSAPGEARRVGQHIGGYFGQVGKLSFGSGHLASWAVGPSAYRTVPHPAVTVRRGTFEWSSRSLREPARAGEQPRRMR